MHYSSATLVFLILLFRARSLSTKSLIHNFLSLTCAYNSTLTITPIRQENQLLSCAVKKNLGVLSETKSLWTLSVNCQNNWVTVYQWIYQLPLYQTRKTMNKMPCDYFPFHMITCLKHKSIIAQNILVLKKSIQKPIILVSC